MWPGQQPPGGEQNPQDPNRQDQNPYQQPGYQQPNPYQQPGYQQPNPYQQQGQWHAPTVPAGPAQVPAGDGGSGGSGGGNRTKVIAIVAAAAVVVAAGVTGFLLLGGDKDDDKKSEAKPPASPSAPAKDEPGASGGQDEDEGRGGPGAKPVVKGWKTVVNPRWGTAFDVPPDWEVLDPGTLTFFEERNEKSKNYGKPLITMTGVAKAQTKWCTSDEDRDGKTEDKSLAGAGTKGANGAKNSGEVAVNQVAWWVYGGYTQPSKKNLHFDRKAKPYTTKSGIKGSIARAWSTDVPRDDKCSSDGKAITFGFKNSADNYVAWSLYGAKGVKDEIPEETVMKILSTVRLHGEPTEG